MLVGHEMLLRIVGAGSIILGICIIALGVSEIDASTNLAAIFVADGHEWNLPLSHDVFLARSKLCSGVVALSGLLTTIAGFGMVYRKGWGLHVEVVAALLILVFPPMSRIFFPNQYAFDGPNLVEFALASLIGFGASLAFMFRAR
jgi:hypothetical protein